jgi:hypothetical protein
MMEEAPLCTWLEEEQDCSIWTTSCDQVWTFFDDGPEENGVKFCPYCGKAVEAVPCQVEEEEE